MNRLSEPRCVKMDRWMCKYKNIYRLIEGRGNLQMSRFLHGRPYKLYEFATSQPLHNEFLVEIDGSACTEFIHSMAVTSAWAPVKNNFKASRDPELTG